MPAIPNTRGRRTRSPRPQNGDHATSDGEISSVSGNPHHLHAHRLRHLYPDTGGRQFTALLIDPKDDQTVGVLVGDDQELPGRIDGEIARHLDLTRLMAAGSEVACLGVDGEDGDAIVAAVGAVEELAAGVNLHLGGAVVAGAGGDHRRGSGNQH